MKNLLQEGHNYWRYPIANRAAFLINGESYFRAVREAICQAQDSIFIVGWDVHSELVLLREECQDDYPVKLGALLDYLVRKRPQLNVYILVWDFAMIYTMEREYFPYYKLSWKSHKRIHFCLDGNHPIGASQHQKIVVIDDQVAFAGGIDLSKWRWDTSAHHLDDKRRTDPDGESYPPFHDVQMIVDGQVAMALGELVRERWQVATQGAAAPLNSKAAKILWPNSVKPSIRDAPIAISRTMPAYLDKGEIREVECLYLDSIAAAQTFIYIENQYFTSNQIVEVLIDRLKQDKGPEIVIIMPEKTGGWLEQHTMDVLRNRQLKKLRTADIHKRLGIYYTRLSKEPHISLMIHAKVMIIDDVFVRVGSSNISNRSMGFDSECDLSLVSTDNTNVKHAITEFRHRLLAEHFSTDVKNVATAEKHQQSLIKTLTSLQGGIRSLQPLNENIEEDVDNWVPDSTILDPEKPVEPEELLNQFIKPEQRKPTYKYLLRISLLVFCVFALAAIWRWTELSTWVSAENAEIVVEWIKDSSLSPLLVLLFFILGSVFALPITFIIIATISVYGPWLGGIYALLGTEIAALVTFGIGHLLGHEGAKRIAGSIGNRLMASLSKRGVLSIIFFRIVPVAPFSIINIIAGVSGIKLRDFAIGNFIGIIPGVLAITLLTDRVLVLLKEANWQNIILLSITSILVILFLFKLRQWVKKQRQSRQLYP